MKLVQTAKEKGYLIGFLMGAVKIAMAILSRSVLFLIYAAYSIIKACAMRYALKNRGGHNVTMFYSGWLVIAASAVYLVYSLYIFAFGCSSEYHQFVAIGIAALTTYEYAAAVYGLRKAKKERSIRRETVKYVGLASALISVSLTQTALLSFTFKEKNPELDPSKYYAIGDAVFGLLALSVGVLMLVQAAKLKKENAPS